jgi:coenzyme F420-reducing hydrogenase alpha subunit
MHKNFDINVKDLSKIEGHASLSIKVRNGMLLDVQLKISDNKRFYTQAIRGKPCLNVPLLVSRICGTCSFAHLICCTEAVEKAIKIKPTEQTMLLRKLAMYGTVLRDHAMHLYFFCLPDIFGKDSALDFEGREKEFLHHALHMKAAGNSLATLVAGRAVHPTSAVVGGFTSIPKKGGIVAVVKQLKEVRPYVFDLIDIFFRNDWEFKRDTDFVALVTKDFSFLEGEIRSTEGLHVQEQDYFDHLQRIVIPYSQASAYEFEGKEYMVGALARINLSKHNLHKDVRKDVGRYLLPFPSNNIFHNNLAQAIEMLHCIDHSIELLETMEFKQERPVVAVPKKGIGVGVIEAPRGTLYYMMNIDNFGRIIDGNLVIPTAQNQINMQNDIWDLVEHNLDKSKEEIQQKVERLIRAYDPCMSCATHFLKVNWI